MVVCSEKVALELLVGGFAKCYEGLSIETQKLTAIKMIDKVTLQKQRAKQKVSNRFSIVTVGN